MSTRERAYLVLGFVGALLLVLYPLAYRLTSEAEDTTAATLATAQPTIRRSATASPVSTPLPAEIVAADVKRAT